jgi:hypothetical protein
MAKTLLSYPNARIWSCQIAAVMRQPGISGKVDFRVVVRAPIKRICTQGSEATVAPTLERRAVSGKNAEEGCPSQ